LIIAANGGYVGIVKLLLAREEIEVNIQEDEVNTISK
jgi:hypothetical protein